MEPDASALTSETRSDPEIARAAATALEGELPYSAPLIRISVHDGEVTLDGSVQWDYQKTRAAEAVAKLGGVKRVTNLIELHGHPVASDIRQHITAAFQRCAQLDADSIEVTLEGDQVTLTGRVHSWAAHEAAADIAGSTPGVKAVRNLICVNV